MSTQVVVTDRLMTGAAEEILHLFSPPKEQTSEVPAALIEGLIEYLGEDLACDHAVNLCACGTRQLVYELELALNREIVCPRCGGEGFDWNQETYDKAAAEILALGYSPSDGDGYVKCPTCNTSGRVRRPRKNRAITDDLLRSVAEVYRANFSRAPTRAVAKYFGVGGRMASTYVQTARKHGMLPPTVRGKKKA